MYIVVMVLDSVRVQNCSVGKNVIIFGVASSSSVNIDNKGRYHNSWQSSNTKIR